MPDEPDRDRQCSNRMEDFDRLPEELRKELMSLFKSRCERLLKWIEMDAPGAILCGEVKLVMEAAFVLYPSSMGSQYAESIRERSLAKLGICRDCYGERTVPPTACATCEEKFAAEMDQSYCEAAEEAHPQEEP